MRLDTTSPSIWPFILFGEDRRVKSDADALVRLCGGSALEAAELKALHEDLGFLRTPRAGHWGRVAREVARRTGKSDSAPAVRLVA